MTDKSDIAARLENRAQTLAQTALNGRDIRLIKLLETAAKEITALRASLQPATPAAGKCEWPHCRCLEANRCHSATGGDAVAGDVQSTKQININVTVKVKLTEVGTARWRGKHNVTRTELELPLWELMAEFGPVLHMGMSQMYFVDNEIEIC